MPTIQVRVKGRERLEALARRLDAAAVELQPLVTAAVQAEAPLALAAVRSAWATIDVQSTGRGGSSSGLRARVAAATESLATSLGVAFQVDGSRVDPRYGKTLVYGLDGLGAWVHPVFGRPGTRTQQRGSEVFLRTLQGWEPQYVKQLERVVEALARRIEG